MRIIISLFLLVIIGCKSTTIKTSKVNEVAFQTVSKGALFGNGMEGISESNFTINNAKEWETFLKKTALSNKANTNFSNDVIQVYPNPTTGLVNLNFKNISNLNFEIFSINGKLIKNYTDYRHNQVDFNYLDNGVYFIRFYINNKVVVKKMIKKYV